MPEYRVNWQVDAFNDGADVVRAASREEAIQSVSRLYPQAEITSVEQIADFNLDGEWYKRPASDPILSLNESILSENASACSTGRGDSVTTTANRPKTGRPNGYVHQQGPTWWLTYSIDVMEGNRLVRQR